jgi:uncharacterized paraquat-inducible protein A
VSDVPINCPNCGAKVSAGRDRCPRCRAVLRADEPAHNPKHSQRLMAITAVLILLFAAVLLFLWYSGPSAGS